MLDCVVLGAIGRVMGHAEFQANAVGQVFQVVLEDITIAGVAAASVAEKQHSTCVGKGKLAVRLPPIRDAVAGEPTGIVAEAQVQVAEVSFEVVEAVRIDHAHSSAGEIVVESLFGNARIESADAEQQPQEFLVFGVDAEDGIGRVHECVAVAGNDLKLPIATSMFSQGE